MRSHSVLGTHDLMLAVFLSFVLSFLLSIARFSVDGSCRFRREPHVEMTQESKSFAGCQASGFSNESAMQQNPNGEAYARQGKDQKT